MRGVLGALAEDLQIRGQLDIRDAFIDGSFTSRSFLALPHSSRAAAATDQQLVH